MGQVLNVVSDLVVNVSASANPNNFSGGQKQYEQMMYRYLYQDCDISKGLQLLQFAEKNISNTRLWLTIMMWLDPKIMGEMATLHCGALK